MKNNEEENQRRIVGHVLKLRLDFRTLKFLSSESAKAENSNTINVFNNLFGYIEGLIWNRLVITIGWLYHKKAYEKDKRKNRSLYWYVEQSPNEAQKNKQMKLLDGVLDKVEKVLKIRDKAGVAHLDKVFLENEDDFFKKFGDLTLADIEPLVKTAEKIVYENHPTMDLSASGVETPFLLMKIMSENNSNFIYDLRRLGLLR